VVLEAIDSCNPNPKRPRVKSCKIDEGSRSTIRIIPYNTKKGREEDLT